MKNAAEILAPLVTEVLGGKLTDVSEIPDVLQICMQAAGDMKDLSGQEKKEAVVRALQMGIDASDIAGPLEGVVLGLVPSLCDLIVDVENGQVVINKRLKAGCCSLFGKP